MITAIILSLVLLGLIAGTVVSLRSSSKTGMPSRDVLERATRRARELESRDKDEV